jgi:hypothetical protein
MYVGHLACGPRVARQVHAPPGTFFLFLFIIIIIIIIIIFFVPIYFYLLFRFVLFFVIFKRSSKY